jgi:hypothetical protein
LGCNEYEEVLQTSKWALAVRHGFLNIRNYVRVVFDQNA